MGPSVREVQGLVSEVSWQQPPLAGGDNDKQDEEEGHVEVVHFPAIPMQHNIKLHGRDGEDELIQVHHHAHRPIVCYCGEDVDEDDEAEAEEEEEDDRHANVMCLN
jgi:hypothetical protein